LGPAHSRPSRIEEIDHAFIVGENLQIHPAGTRIEPWPCSELGNYQGCEDAPFTLRHEAFEAVWFGRSVDTTPPLFGSSAIPVTLTEFRIRLNDFAEYFVAVIEDAGEQVIDGSDDQLVRRNAMEFRLRAVNNFLNSLNQTDPVASLIDAWTFCLQLHQFVETGAGS